MFRPFGASPCVSTVAPRWRKTAGAIADADPFAQSSRRRRPRKRPAGTAAFEDSHVAADERHRRDGATRPSRGVGTAGSRMIVSMRDSIASSSFMPSREKTLRPLSSNGLWLAEIITPGVERPGLRGEREARRRDHAGVRQRAASTAQAVGDRVPQPRPGLARVAPADHPRRAAERARQHLGQREAEFPHGRRIERRRAGDRLECRRFQTVVSSGAPADVRPS